MTGRGLLTSDGSFWLRQRRLEQPAFARSRLEALDRIVVPATQAMLAGWETALPADDPIDVDAEMMRLALEIVGKALFSIDLSREAHRLTQAVLTALDHIIYRVRHPISLPGVRSLRFRQALRTLDQAVYELLAQRRRADPGDDLLGMLLRARDEETGAPMNDRQLRDEIITILIAGHETVASALTWAWHLLAQHPAAWQQLSAEVHTALGDRLPATADLERMPSLGQVFSETLRLYPPAWLITRRALQEDRVRGYRIPAGALMIISPYTIHRHPAYWRNPEAFEPGRFDASSGTPGPRYAYIPFGGGPRLCIGNQFATIEAQLILALVAQRFRLEALPGRPVQVEALVTLRPRGGLPMRLRPAFEG